MVIDFSANVIIEQDKKTVLNRLSMLDRKAHLHNVVIQADEAEKLNNATTFTKGIVKLKSYSSSRTELDVNIQIKSLLVIANSWSPNWKVDVDGKSRQLIRVNHAQFGVLLFQGDKKVNLYYSPPYFARLQILNASAGKGKNVS